jgi:Mrp family chromosome partitioning ATPase
MVAVAQKRSAEAESSALRYAFSPDLVTLNEGRAAEAEAIRTIRTHIIARHLNDGRRGLAICGPKPGVGCTFTAANLAVAMSQVGVATLLIDTDLRKPGIPELIRPDHDPAPASVEHELGRERIHPEVLPNLSVLYANGIAGGADELLGGEGFRRLMDRCLRDFEFTIVDTSPASESSDALRVASVVGYALVVARTNVTRLKDVEHLAKDLQEDGARVIGAVLNEV